MCPAYFWWELVEMLKRFLLVGLYVLDMGPFLRGSVMQLALANFTMIIFLVAQLQAQPYVSLYDDYLAIGGTLSLNLMFVCAIFFKYTGLTQLNAISSRMSLEQRNEFHSEGLVLTTVCIGSVIGSLVVSAIVLLFQLRKEARERRNALARRLRYTTSGEEVVPPTIAADAFHIFLSHVWGTGALLYCRSGL